MLDEHMSPAVTLIVNCDYHKCDYQIDRGTHRQMNQDKVISISCYAKQRKHKYDHILYLLDQEIKAIHEPIR